MIFYKYLFVLLLALKDAKTCLIINSFKYFQKGMWQNSSGHKRRIFVDKMGEFWRTLFLNSPGYFCPLEFLFLGEFLRTHPQIHPLKMSTKIYLFWKKYLLEFIVHKNSSSHSKPICVAYILAVIAIWKIAIIVAISLLTTQ